MHPLSSESNFVLSSYKKHIIVGILRFRPVNRARPLPPAGSDTEDRTDYQLDAPLLEYHLYTLTRRNQTHDFEIFCRKLCERAICRNL